MKSFLKHKASNTVSEACLGTYCGYGIREELYQNQDGEFFLVGKGGPSTKYAVHCCGNLIGGSKITPLSYESAQEWGKDKLSETEFETIFSCHERSDAGVEKSKGFQK